MTMDGTAFLFPGQGAQFVGMARDLIGQDERTTRFLSPAEGRVATAGTDAGIRAIEPLWLAAGAGRVVRLPVSAAFHSPLMASAAEAFGQAWQQIPLEPLAVPQVFNTDARVHASPAEVRPLLARQLTGPVRWTASLERLAALGVRTFVEIGPQRPLTGLGQKILSQGAVAHVAELA